MREHFDNLSSKLKNVLPSSQIKPFRASLKGLMRDYVATMAFQGIGLNVSSQRREDFLNVIKGTLVDMSL